MKKQMRMGCLALFLFTCFLQLAFAASTCDYSEQVQLSNMASTVQANYEIETTCRGENGVVDCNSEEVTSQAPGEDDYVIDTSLKVYLLNITDQIYVRITSDNGMNETYHFADTNNGTIEFSGGDFSKIVTYTIVVYSDSSRCLGDELRTITVVTPMVNDWAYTPACFTVPNLPYCQEYITTPFYASDTEIQQTIEEGYRKYLSSAQPEDKEENKGFWENVFDFFQANRVIIIAIVVVVIAGGALTAYVIIKKRRSRIL